MVEVMPNSRPPRPAPSRRRGRRPAREALSLEAFLAGAIELLDEQGIAGFTFRALSERLGVGVGSVYWYVDSKDDLLARATDSVIGRALDAVEAGSRDGDTVTARSKRVAQSLTAIRRICLAVFDEMERHPWVAPQLIGSNEMRENSLRLYDAIGQQLMPLSLTDRQQFYSASALINYVNGVAAAMDDQDQRVVGRGGSDRAEIMREEIDSWLANSHGQLPFVDAMIETFRQHSEVDQFTFGLDLMLSGIRQQAESR